MGPLVLIVDDNEHNQQARPRRAAGRRNPDARGWSRWPKPIALAAEHLPDVILMDLRLPDMDGGEAAATLANEAGYGADPRRRDERAKAGGRARPRTAGFAGYIGKPISIPRVSEAGSPVLPRLSDRHRAGTPADRDAGTLVIGSPTAIIGMKRGNPRRSGRWRNRPSRRDPPPRRTGYARDKRLLRSCREQRRPRWLAVPGRRECLGLVTGVVLLAALGLCVSAASSQDQAPRKKKAFHATKDCSGFSGLVGAYCTIRTSTSRRSRPARRSSTSSRPSETGLDSDISHLREARHRRNRPLLPSFRDRDRTVHDLERDGKLAGFHLRVRVAADTSIPKLFHWDGTYSF